MQGVFPGKSDNIFLPSRQKTTICRKAAFQRSKAAAEHCHCEPVPNNVCHCEPVVLRAANQNNNDCQWQSYLSVTQTGVAPSRDSLRSQSPGHSGSSQENPQGSMPSSTRNIPFRQRTDGTMRASSPTDFMDLRSQNQRKSEFSISFSGNV